MNESLVRRLGAEFLGTFVLVFVGCGAAILDAGNKGIDFFGVAMAFGVAVMVMVYAVGAVSGGADEFGVGHRPALRVVDGSVGRGEQLRRRLQPGRGRLEQRVEHVLRGPLDG